MHTYSYIVVRVVFFKAFFVGLLAISHLLWRVCVPKIYTYILLLSYVWYFLRHFFVGLLAISHLI